jgi:uncharacterized membrane protein HdeD (DUF308 family)
MIGVVARNWWTWLIRGLAAIIFGALAFLWPGATILAVGILFGAYAFVDGVFAIVATIRAVESHQRWWPLLIEGIVGILIAAITFYDIRITLLALYLTIAAWAFLTGALEIIAAIQLRKLIANEFWLIIGGIASIIFGVLMLWRPMAGALAIIWLIGAYAIFFGVLMVAFAFRLRAHATAGTPAT